MVGASPRAVVLGVLLCVTLNLLAVHSYVVADRYTGFADHFNTVGAIFLLFLLVLATLALGKAWPRGRLLPGEFTVIYAMLLVAAAVPTMGLGGYLFGLLSGVTYYANPENRWLTTLHPLLPGWAVPKQAEAMRYFYEALPAGAAIPWGIWARPLLWWGVFALAFYAVSITAMIVIRRQWVEREHLAYPLTSVPLALAESLAAGSRGGILRARLTWLGFLTAFCPAAYVWAHAWVPAMSAFPGLSLGRVVSLGPNGPQVSLLLDPLQVGLTYLVNLDVACGVWVFHWLIVLEQWIFGRLGIAQGPGDPHAAGGAALSSQQVGALLLLVILSLWTARKSLGNDLKLAFRQQGGAREGEVLPIRWAVVAMAGGLLGMGFFLRRTGMPVALVAVFLLAALALFFGVTRVLVQTGLGRLRAPVAAAPFVVGILGSRPFRRAGMAALGLTFVWAGDIQLFVMGTSAHGLRALSERRVRAQGVLAAMALAFLASLAATFLTYLVSAYRFGALHGYVWYFQMSPRYHWGWVAQTITSPKAQQWLHLTFLGIGALAAGAVGAAHRRFLGWPLHPVGLAIGMINTVWWDWLSIFLAWLVKALVLHYAGLAGFRKSLPFFWGLILGSCVGQGVTVVGDSLLRMA